MTTNGYRPSVSGLPTIDATLDSTLDYPFDWSAWLLPLGETIQSHTVTVSAGLTLESETATGTSVIPFISANAVGPQQVSCTIVTATRDDTRTIIISVLPQR